MNFFLGGGGQVQYFAIGNLYRSKLTSSVHGRRNRVGGGMGGYRRPNNRLLPQKKKSKKKNLQDFIMFIENGISALNIGQSLTCEINRLWLYIYSYT